MKKEILVLFLVVISLLLPSIVFASYSATFVDTPSSVNVGASFTMNVQVTNSSGTGSGSASVTISYDSNYFSTSDSNTKSCSFGGSNVCTATWSFTALKSGSKTMSATATIGSETADATSSTITLSSPTSYTLTFSDDDSDNVLSSGQTVALSLTVRNTGQSATANADLSLTGFSLTSGSSSVSLGTIAEGGQTTTSWTVQHDGSTTSPSATVTVTGGDTRASSLSFSYSSGQQQDAGTGTSGSVGATGGAANVTVSVSRGKANITVPLVAAGKMANVTISKTEDMGITFISILVSNSANNIRILITKLPGQPASIIHEITGNVYHYIEINKTGITDGNVNKTIIRFRVEKSWINSNNINSSTIVLNRYSNNAWSKLVTKKISEDSTDVYFEAESPGLSVFAISGEVSTVSQQCPTCPSPSSWNECTDGKQTRTNYQCSADTSYQCKSYTEEQGCEAAPIAAASYMWSIMIALIVFVASGLVFVTLRHFKNKPKEASKE